MKKIKKLIITLILSFVLLSYFADTCPGIIGTTTVRAASIKLNKTKIALIKGKTYQLKMVGTSKNVTWKSNASKIASVNKKGLITAKKAGAAKITATVNKKKYVCTVSVEAPKLNKTSVTINIGKKVQLKLAGTKQKTTWKSSKTSVASVSKNGLVTGKKAGKANITATVNGVKYTCKVTVKATPKPTATPKPPTTPKPTATPTPTAIPVQFKASTESIEINEKRSS